MKNKETKFLPPSKYQSMKNFHKIHFNSSQLDSTFDDSLQVKIPAIIRGLIANDPEKFESLNTKIPEPEDLELSARLINLGNLSQEHAARYFLQLILQEQDNEKLNELTSPESSRLVPDMQIKENKLESLTRTQIVLFEQTSNSIPIFGSKVIVEVEVENKKLIAIDANLAETPNVLPTAKLSWQNVFRILAEICKVEPDESKVKNTPYLEYFQDEESQIWHLVYHFKTLSMLPPEEDFDIPDGISPVKGLFDYFKV